MSSILKLPSIERLIGALKSNSAVDTKLKSRMLRVDFHIMQIFALTTNVLVALVKFNSDPENYLRCFIGRQAAPDLKAVMLQKCLLEDRKFVNMLPDLSHSLTGSNTNKTSVGTYYGFYPLMFMFANMFAVYF